MKKRWAYVIQIALLLAMISGLAIGCGGTSSVLTPPDSEYPADIIGRVTIANNIIVGQKEIPPLEGRVYWIIEASVRNKDYQNPVTQDNWIIADGQGQRFKSPNVTIEKGQTGTVMLVFLVVSGVKPEGHRICYQGSYGELITGDTVAVYNWDLQKVTQVEVSQENVATVKDISCVTDLLVELHPTNHTVANKVYVVDLYEKGNFRARTKVSWNQPEINVSSMKLVSFPLTWEEEKAYRFKDISHIFSVKVYEQN